MTLLSRDILNIPFVVSRTFMAGTASQAGDADSSRAPGLTSCLQVHRPPWCSIVGAVKVHQFFCIFVIDKWFYLSRINFEQSQINFIFLNLIYLQFNNIISIKHRSNATSQIKFIKLNFNLTLVKINAIFVKFI